MNRFAARCQPGAVRAQVRANTARAGRLATLPAADAVSDDDDQCMGCMQVRANVRLLRQCHRSASADGRQACRGNECFCRPMWCLDWCVDASAGRACDAPPDAR